MLLSSKVSCYFHHKVSCYFHSKYHVTLLQGIMLLSSKVSCYFAPALRRASCFLRRGAAEDRRVLQNHRGTCWRQRQSQRQYRPRARVRAYSLFIPDFPVGTSVLPSRDKRVVLCGRKRSRRATLRGGDENKPAQGNPVSEDPSLSNRKDTL